MKKVFGLILIVFGITSLFSYLCDGNGHGGAEIFGAFLGTSLVTFLPAYFLLRTKKNFEEGDKHNK